MMQTLGNVRPLSFDGGAGELPLFRSSDSGWRGVPFEVHRSRPFVGERDSGPPNGQLTLIVVVEGTTQLVFRENGHEVAYSCGPGTLSFHTHEDRPRLVRATGTAQLAAFRLQDAWRERLLQHGAPIRPSYQPPMAADPTLRDLALAMWREAEANGRSGALFADSVSLAFLAYAVDRLPTTHMRLPIRGTLSDGHQRRLRRYIEDRLHDDLRVEELAGLCGLRSRQFSTVFKRTFGKTPYRYVLDRRLARGAALLREADRDIAEIAARLGFSSSSHFSTEFRRSYGIAPTRYSKARRAGPEDLEARPLELECETLASSDICAFDETRP
jgi:AraC-like DNA-binding protein